MLKINLPNISVVSANPKKNFASIKESIEKAQANKQNIILFPEMCLPGYFNGDIWEQSSFLKECEYYHEKIKNLSQNLLIIFGSVGCDWSKKNEDGRVRKYNAAFCAFNGKFLKNSKTNFYFWPKTLMPNYREFDDSRHFFDLRKLALEKNCPLQNLYEPVQFTLNGQTFSIGISICEDAWAENYSLSPVELFQHNYLHDFFVNISCSPFGLGKNNRREIIFSTLAQKINVPIYYSNCAGVQNVGKTIYGFDGYCALYEPNGSVQKIGAAFIDSRESAPYDQIIALEYITKNICMQWGIHKVVIGVSGGIDSALSATLMTRVLGKENVYLINMPSKFNSKLTIQAAQQLAKNLGCAYTSIPIDDSVKHSHDQLSELEFENSPQKIKVTTAVLENIQARDRGARILSAIAAALGAVFTCNANKSELTVGYGTLYGDIAGFLCPLSDLWKHDVYELAKYYNEFIFKNEIIPKTSLEVVPSAELSEEQNVLAGKGDPLIYSYHDFLFRSWVEDWERKTPEDCLNAYLENRLEQMIGCETGLVKKLFPSKHLFCEDLERWWALYQGLGAVKRMQAPPIVALTRRAFGFDHREHLGSCLLTQKYFELKEAGK